MSTGVYMPCYQAIKTIILYFYIYIFKTFFSDESTKPRSRHRLRLLFPLLLRISTRLATLIPVALLGVVGVFLFVTFSKKALLVSLLVLYLTLKQKYELDFN